MTEPDFILTTNGLRRYYDIETHDHVEIDMFRQPVKGSHLIQNLYAQCKPGKAFRFKFILSWFSEPRLDLTSLNDQEIEDVLMKCLDQWHFFSSQYQPGQGHDNILQSTTTCCCSQAIVNQYYFRNHLNGNILLIGSSCIKKFAEKTRLYTDYDYIRKIMRKCYTCKRKVLCTEITSVDGHDFCRTCHQGVKNYGIAEVKQICLACLKVKKCKYERCKKCYQSNRPKLVIVDEKNLKNCQDCRGFFFPSEAWKKICGSCYKKKLRSCQVCQEQFFAPEDWKKTCLSCYNLKLAPKANTAPGKTCPQCRQKFNPKGDWQKVCYTCWQKK